MGSARFCWVAVVTAAVVGIVAGGARAALEVVAVGSEFQVNTYTAGNQGAQKGYLYAGMAVAAVPSGGFVVVWQDYDGLDGEGPGIFARHFDSQGQAQGEQFQVNTYTSDAQRYPKVAVNDDGRFVVVWESGGYNDGDGFGVFARRYDASGASFGDEFAVNTYTSGRQWRPDACALTNGGFAVVWEGSNATDDIFGRTFDSMGVAASVEFAVNQYTTDFQQSPAVACDGMGDFVVVWQSQGQAGRTAAIDVFGRWFGADGAPKGPEFLVNAYTTGQQTEPAVSVGAGGDALVVWRSAGEPGPGGIETGIFARRLVSGGNPIGTDFAVNDYATGDQYLPRVAADTDGGFVVAWTSTPEFGSGSPQDGSERGCFARRIGRVGAAAGDEFQVNTYTTGHQQGATPAVDTTGSIVIAWTSGPKTAPSTGQDGDGFGVFAQRYRLQPPAIDPCGNPVAPEKPDVMAADALAVLRAAVGLLECDACVCDVDGSGSASATDALAVLQRAVGLNRPFDCPPCT